MEASRSGNDGGGLTQALSNLLSSSSKRLRISWVADGRYAQAMNVLLNGACIIDSCISAFTIFNPG